MNSRTVYSTRTGDTRVTRPRMPNPRQVAHLIERHRRLSGEQS